MMKPTPEDDERWKQLKERGEAARRNMQEVIDRYDARRRAEEERRASHRSLLDRVLGRGRAA